MLRHRVLHRREDVSHEDHRRHQARHEENRVWTGPPVTQKPRPERRSGCRVWRELSGHVARERQGRAEAALTHIGQEDEDWASGHFSQETLFPQGQFWQCTDGPPADECAASIFKLFVVFIAIVHAAKLIHVQVRDCLSSDCYVNLHTLCKWPFGWKWLPEIPVTPGKLLYWTERFDFLLEFIRDNLHIWISFIVGFKPEALMLVVVQVT